MKENEEKNNQNVPENDLPNVQSVIDLTYKIGRDVNKMWDENKDLKFAQTAIQAYNASIQAAKAQVVYKKLTGNPSRIQFFEE